MPDSKILDKPEQETEPPPGRLLAATKIIEHVAVNECDPSTLETETEEKLHAALTLIFRVAHVAREPSCMDAHEDWEEEFRELVYQLDVEV